MESELVIISWFDLSGRILRPDEVIFNLVIDEVFMNVIDELVKKSRLELEKNNMSMTVTGNRPHFPMVLLFDDKMNHNEYEEIFDVMGRIWPQSLKHIVAYNYGFDGFEINFKARFDNEKKTYTEFLQSLDEAKMARDVFKSMQQWCVYNIIDTSRFDSYEEFETFYYANKSIDPIITDAHKTMLIVLLNDSAAKREQAKKIRVFLSDKKEYDATIVLSNRDRNNQMYEISELYRIVANIIAISNNDSVFETDSADYGNRVSALYDKTTHIVSYIRLDKPTNKIGIQINNAVFEEANKMLNAAKPFETSIWAKRLGFDRSYCDICENFIKSVEPLIDGNVFLHLPMKSIPGKIDISQMQYEELKNYIFADVFQGFVSDYCERRLMAEYDVTECVEEFKQHVLSSFTAGELLNLTDEAIEMLIGNLNVGSLNEKNSISNYFKQCIHLYLRKNVIYPAFKNTLRELKNKSEKCILLFNNFFNQFKTYLPLKMNETLGTYYQNVAVSYFQTEQGERHVRNVLRASNCNEDFAESAFECLKKIVEYDHSAFSMSFTEEWSKRLGQSGDMIYKKISNEITTGADEAIKLCGNYALNKKLKVLMLHTGNVDGTAPTELYVHVKQTFCDDQLVRYFNTGYDDAMEAITFIECCGTDLII